jgi:hypothetical protein
MRQVIFYSSILLFLPLLVAPLAKERLLWRCFRAGTRQGRLLLLSHLQAGSAGAEAPMTIPRSRRRSLAPTTTPRSHRRRSGPRRSSFAGRSAHALERGADLVSQALAVRGVVWDGLVILRGGRARPGFHGCSPSWCPLCHALSRSGPERAAGGAAPVRIFYAPDRSAPGCSA